ncbi:arginosuccinate synthase family protein, partial [Vibrio parahaemolyticus V-223/04]
QTTSTQH